MTRTEALTFALKLAVQAPTQEKSDMALARAKDIAVGMSSHDVDIAKKAAECAVEYERKRAERAVEYERKRGEAA